MSRDGAGNLTERKITSDCKASVYETANVAVDIIYEGLLKPLTT